MTETSITTLDLLSTDCLQSLDSFSTHTTASSVLVSPETSSGTEAAAGDFHDLIASVYAAIEFERADRQQSQPSCQCQPWIIPTSRRVCTDLRTCKYVQNVQAVQQLRDQTRRRLAFTWLNPHLPVTIPNNHITTSCPVPPSIASSLSSLNHFTVTIPQSPAILADGSGWTSIGNGGDGTGHILWSASIFACKMLHAILIHRTLQHQLQPQSTPDNSAELSSHSNLNDRLSNLFNDGLSMIYSFLDLMDSVSLSLVSHRLYSMVSMGRPRSLVLSPESHASIATLFISPFRRHVTQLDLNMNESIFLSDMNMMMMNLPRLTSCTFRITDRYQPLLAINYPETLQTMELDLDSESDDFPPMVEEYIYKTLPTSLTNLCIKKEHSAKVPLLARLTNLTSCTLDIRRLSFASMIEFLNATPSLREFYYPMYCTGKIQELATLFAPQLERFDVSLWSFKNPGFFDQFQRSLPGLTALPISCFDSIDLTPLSQWPQLKEIVIRIPNPSRHDDLFRGLAECRAITSLRLGFSVKEYPWRRVFTNNPHLTDLQLWANGRIPSLRFLRTTPAATQLTSLALGSCRLPPAQLKFILASTQLKSLNIGYDTFTMKFTTLLQTFQPRTVLPEATDLRIESRTTKGSHERRITKWRSIDDPPSQLNPSRSFTVTVPDQIQSDNDNDSESNDSIEASDNPPPSATEPPSTSATPYFDSVPFTSIELGCGTGLLTQYLSLIAHPAATLFATDQNVDVITEMKQSVTVTVDLGEATAEHELLPKSFTTPQSAAAPTSIIGTCENLEKDYVRLTSAPDPATVRPPGVLVKALDMIKQKWSESHDYDYACNQLRSIRQDCAIQHLRDTFALDVYETHARIALECGDDSEFAACQSQLRLLEASSLQSRLQRIQILPYAWSTPLLTTPEFAPLRQHPPDLILGSDLLYFSIAFPKLACTIWELFEQALYDAASETEQRLLVDWMGKRARRRHGLNEASSSPPSPSTASTSSSTLSTPLLFLTHKSRHAETEQDFWLALAGFTKIYKLKQEFVHLLQKEAQDKQQSNRYPKETKVDEDSSAPSFSSTSLPTWSGFFYPLPLDCFDPFLQFFFILPKFDTVKLSADATIVANEPASTHADTGSLIDLELFQAGIQASLQTFQPAPPISPSSSTTSPHWLMQQFPVDALESWQPTHPAQSHNINQK